MVAYHTYYFRYPTGTFIYQFRYFIVMVAYCGMKRAGGSRGDRKHPTLPGATAHMRRVGERKRGPHWKRDPRVRERIWVIPIPDEYEGVVGEL